MASPEKIGGGKDTAGGGNAVRLILVITTNPPPIFLFNISQNFYFFQIKVALPDLPLLLQAVCNMPVLLLRKFLN